MVKRLKEVMDKFFSMLNLDQKVEIFKEFNNETFDDKKYDDFIKGVREELKPDLIRIMGRN